jgi:hypothetical protein
VAIANHTKVSYYSTDTHSLSLTLSLSDKQGIIIHTTDWLSLQGHIGVARLEWRQIDSRSKQLHLARLGNADSLEEHQQQLETRGTHVQLVLTTENLLQNRSYA